MKLRIISMCAFAIAMGYGGVSISECGKRYDAYSAALSDIESECAEVYIDLELD